MKLSDVALAALVAGGVIATGLILRARGAVPATLYMHIKHDPTYPSTLGSVQEIYSQIQLANNTGREIGLQPQCVSDWQVQLSYYAECEGIPVMAAVLAPNPYGEGEPYKLSISEINEIRDVSNVRILSIHEAVSYYRDVLSEPFPVDYVTEILEYARSVGLPVFWSEWDWRAFPVIADVIAGFEDTVIVSFGTNANYIEPADAYQEYLQQFTRKGASVQSWYWWERHDREPGTELEMPPELMVQHTQEAFNAGCEIVQYEPFWYFFDIAEPRPSLSAVLGSTFI